jgi:hypothetical protein
MATTNFAIHFCMHLIIRRPDAASAGVVALRLYALAGRHCSRRVLNPLALPSGPLFLPIDHPTADKPCEHQTR